MPNQVVIPAKAGIHNNTVSGVYHLRVRPNLDGMDARLRGHDTAFIMALNSK
jgi:hypothetical protein